MFSKTCEYAIKSTIYIASHAQQNACVGFKEIAEGILAPEPFIAKILQQLVKNKIINSVKGPNGGFWMDNQQINAPILIIVKLFDGEVAFEQCVLGLEKCSSANPCPMHFECLEIKKNIRNMLTNNSIKDFKNLVNSNKSFLKLV